MVFGRKNDVAAARSWWKARKCLSFQKFRAEVINDAPTSSVPFHLRAFNGARCKLKKTWNFEWFFFSFFFLHLACAFHCGCARFQANVHKNQNKSEKWNEIKIIDFLHSEACHWHRLSFRKLGVWYFVLYIKILLQQQRQQQQQQQMVNGKRMKKERKNKKKKIDRIHISWTVEL